MPQPPGPARCRGCPPIPDALLTDKTWGTYLAARADLVTDLAAQVRDRTHTTAAPAWVRHGQARPDPALLADVAVWRAATGVPDSDRRPTGPRQPVKAFALHQRQLESRLTGDRSPALAEWGHLLHQTAPAVRGDEFTPVLAERLAAVSRAGIDAHHLLRAAAAEADLPDDHAAAALWWRISRHLTPAVATSVDDDQHTLTPTWTTHLTTVLGTERARDLQDSPFWPALVTAVDHALARGHRLDTVTAMAGSLDPTIDVEPCQALVWRLSVLTDPPPALHDDAGPACRSTTLPRSRWRTRRTDGGHPTAAPSWRPPPRLTPSDCPPQVASMTTRAVDDPDHVHADLLAAALYRESMGVLEPTDAQIERMVARAAAWDHAVADPARLVQINTMAMDFYAANVDAAWAGNYLDDRLPGWRDHPHIAAGYAPAGWTAAGGPPARAAASPTTSSSRPAWPPAPAPGTSSTASATGPSSPSPTRTRSSGSSAAATPTSPTTTTPARSTSTPPTPCCSTREPSSTGRSRHCSRPARPPSWSKDPSTPSPSPSPVDGRYVGVAPLGTALTDDQARQLATLSAQPIVATDADLAGRVAAERAYWLLAQHGADPLAVDLPEGADPASVLHAHGPDALIELLDNARALGQVMIDERLTNLPAPRRHRGRNPRQPQPDRHQRG